MQERSWMSQELVQADLGNPVAPTQASSNELTVLDVAVDGFSIDLQVICGLVWC